MTTQVPIERTPYGGLQQTHERMAKFIADGIREDFGVGSLAGRVMRDAGFPKPNRAKATVIRDYVKKNVGYGNDPPLTEYVKKAKLTLCTGEACHPWGDCDDHVVALLTMLGHLGVDVNILALDYGGGQQPHVLGVFKDDDGQWLEVDSTTDHPIGHVSYAMRKTRIDPFNPKFQPAGEGKGTFVGAGKARQDGLVITTHEAIFGRGIGAGADTVSDDEIKAIILITSGVMDGTDQAVGQCYGKGGMSQSDATDWRGVYNAWRTDLAGLVGPPDPQNLWQQWKGGCLSRTAPSIWTDCLPYYTLSDHWAPAKQALLGYQAKAAEWQKRVQAGCPDYVPPPPPPEPAHQPPGQPNAPTNYGDQVATAAKAIGVLALVGVGVFAIYEVVSITGGIAKAKALISHPRGASEQKLRRKRSRRKMAA